jgi:hypothetical protein
MDSHEDSRCAHIVVYTHRIGVGAVLMRTSCLNIQCKQDESDETRTLATGSSYDAATTRLRRATKVQVEFATPGILQGVGSGRGARVQTIVCSESGDEFLSQCWRLALCQSLPAMFLTLQLEQVSVD